MQKSMIKVIVATLLVMLIGSQFVAKRPPTHSETREFIVSTEGDMDAAQLAAAVGDLSPIVKPLNSLQGNLYLLAVATTAGDDEIVARLERIPGIRTAEPNSDVRTQQ